MLGHRFRNKAFDKIIGMRLREIRQKNGLSLDQLGMKLGISHQQLHKYEKGKSSIKAPLLFEIAYMLDWSTMYNELAKTEDK